MTRYYVVDIRPTSSVQTIWFWNGKRFQTSNDGIKGWKTYIGAHKGLCRLSRAGHGCGELQVRHT